MDHLKPDLAWKIQDSIEGDLTDRRGLGQAWEEIDDDTINEVRETWVNLIRMILKRNEK